MRNLFSIFRARVVQKKVSEAAGQIRDVQEKVPEAVQIFLDHPSAEPNQLWALLGSAGISDEDAWWLFQLVPMGFCHAYFKNQGVGFQDSFICQSAVTGCGTRRELKSEPIYLEAVKIAEQMITSGCSESTLLPVLRISAEYGVVTKLKRPDGSVRGLQLTEPILSEYEKA
jgi:hypothetical protein